jgi:hypothetical protein
MLCRILSVVQRSKSGRNGQRHDRQMAGALHVEHNSLLTLTYLINEGTQYTEGEYIVSVMHPKSKVTI